MTTVRKTEKLANAAKLASAWIARPHALPEKWLYSMGLLSADGLRMPDFLGIGAQKAGTTWLHQNLQHHPDFYFPPHIKEIRFFDARFYMSPAQYAAFFEPAGPRVTGDITPGYGALPISRIRFVRKLIPDARLILILRNPIERAWSHALMDLVDTKQRRFEDVEAWEFRAHFDSRSARRNGAYISMLDNWLHVYPEEQLLVAFFEDIRDHPQELLTRVFRHLGVSVDVDWETFPFRERIKEGNSVFLPDEYRQHLRGLFSAEVEAVAARLGGPATGWS